MPAPPGRWRQKSAALATAGASAITTGVSATTPRRIRTGLRYTVSLAVLGWIAWQVEWRDFANLRGLDWRFALPAVLLAGLAYPLQACRWLKLLAAQDIRPPARWVQAVFWIGNFYNSFLPGGIAGDGVRLHHTWRMAPAHKAGAAASIVADRLLGFAALLVLAAAALGLHLGLNDGGSELRSLFYVSLLALLLLLALALVMTRPALWTPWVGRWLGPDRTAALGAAFAAVGAQHVTLLVVIGLSVMVWLLDFVALWLLAQSVGLAVGPLEMTVAAAAAYVVASLPISIGGHGVREGSLVIVLGWLGVGADAPGMVLLLALAFWAVTTGWSLLGGLATFAVPAAGGIDSAVSVRRA